MTDQPSRAAIVKALEAAGLDVTKHSLANAMDDRAAWAMSVRAHARMIDKYEPSEDELLAEEAEAIAKQWYHNSSRKYAQLALAGIRRGLALAQENDDACTRAEQGGRFQGRIHGGV